MTLGRLVLRSLFFHWRGNLAVLLGVAVGTAVLTGALLVGDSLRGSLRDLTLEQLGWVEHSLISGRFIREQLADQVGGTHVSPVIFLQGSARTEKADGTMRRSGQVNIQGVDERFWRASPPADNAFWQSRENEVIVNQGLADDLNITKGDTITLFLQKVSSVPRETILGRRDASDVVDEVRVKVREVLPNQGAGRFSLNPSPAVPRNAFVPLHMLQARLQQPGRVNGMLVAGSDRASLQTKLREHLTLDDWGLTLHSPETRTQALFDKLDRNRDGKLERNEWNRRVANSFVQAADRNHDGVLDRDEVLAYYREQRSYLSLESRQMLLEPRVVEAARAAAQETGLRASSSLVYLANGISDGKHEIPYSVVAAVEPSVSPPLGPDLTLGGKSLQNDEIALVDWKESPLQAKPGDSIKLTYFLPEIEGRLREVGTTFRLHGVIPLQGAANDPDLTPEFPGITDKLDIREWNPPFPYHNERVQKRDEHYWEEYRTTPKAYITLARGQELWGSRFGQVTAVRMAPDSHADLTKQADRMRMLLLQHLKPEQGGLEFDSVRKRGLLGSTGASDFGSLFLGFSFFLIAAALLLVGLLFRLNLDRRASEIGLLMATGYRRGQIRLLMLAEGSLVAVFGGLIGLGGAILYACLMLNRLQASWPGGLERSFLRLHPTENGGLSFFIGYFAALAVSILTVAWAVRMLGRVSPRALLAGETTEDLPNRSGGGPVRWSLWVSGVSAVVAFALLGLGFTLRDHEARAGTFFGSGALLLTAGLAAVWIWMRRSRHGHVSGHGLAALVRLGARNAARNPVRSLLTAGLLGSATFLVVAVQSFYRDPGRDFLETNEGSGGFALIGEANVPIFQDLGNPAGQDELNFTDQARAAVKGVNFFPIRVHAGDDASCLNLYQPRNPRLLGVPHRLIERGGFKFKEAAAQTAAERANPWLLLEKNTDGEIPVFGEANTVQWMLHKGLGDTWQVRDDRGDEKTFRFVGLLQDSIFQSGLLMSEKNFLKLFPNQEGYSLFLIQPPPDRLAVVRAQLETVLADRGFTATPSVDRLESFLAVENTYLSTFQALGGLGLLLGALGLAVVLVRSIWERRGEFALLRAVGFRQAALIWMLLAENCFLLVLGLAVGTVSAGVAVAPHLLGAAVEVPWLQLIGLLFGVLLVGLISAALAVVSTLRAPLIPALRRE